MAEIERAKGMTTLAQRAGTGAAVGAVLGAVLVLAELSGVLLLAGEAHAIGAYPFLAWAVGAVVGAVAGALLALATRQPMRPEQNPAAAAVPVLFPMLLATGLAFVVIVQVNHRWLPSYRQPASLAASLALAAGLVLLGWIGRRPLGRLGGYLLGSARRLGVAFVATPALAGIVTLSASEAPRSLAVTPWRPAPNPVLPLTRSPAGDLRLLVVGVDGARWEILNPWIAEGRLPNLASLVGKGRRGVLRNPDIEGHPSPVAWTSIFTGVGPRRHGITGWEANSRSRVAKALWEILEERGWRSAVVNVPGTYPADPLTSGILIAGDPVPSAMTGTSSGWWCSRRPESPPDRATPCLIPAAQQPGARVTLSLVNPHGVATVVAETSLGLVLWALDIEPRVLQRVLASVSPVLLELDLEVPPEHGAEAVRGWLPGTDRLLFELRAGEWGPWLEVHFRDESYLFRPLWARVDSGESGLYFTPFFHSAVPDLAQPPALLPWLEQGGDPYLLGGDASSFGTGDSGLVASQSSLLQQLADRRARAATRLLSITAWDALFHVFTVTDRSQHAFWRFLEPQRYSLLERPSAKRVQAFGGTIAGAYERVDRWLGTLLASTGDSTLILVLSDHGAQGGMGLAYDHHQDGIYLLAGPTVPAVDPADRGLGPTLQHVDVLPLLLAHLGLPLARDLPGTVPPELAPRGADDSLLPLPEAIATYGERSLDGAGRDALDPELRRRLRSLGYLQE